jgi:hypothetical protein
VLVTKSPKYLEMAQGHISLSVMCKFHLNRSSFGSVSHHRTKFRADEINTSSRQGFGPIQTFRCLIICDSFVLLVSCEY